jgi:hypothetical protein
MTDIHQPLRDALKAGPTGGPWNVDEDDGMPPDRWSIWGACGRFICKFVRLLDGSHEQQKADIRYIAVANPAAISALLAERDVAVKDAERYRWLSKRMAAADFDWNESGIFGLVFEMPHDLAVSASCDDTIDAAMALSQINAAGREG